MRATVVTLRRQATWPTGLDETSMPGRLLEQQQIKLVMSTVISLYRLNTGDPHLLPQVASIVVRFPGNDHGAEVKTRNSKLRL
jgi:hypothetical protein